MHHVMLEKEAAEEGVGAVRVEKLHVASVPCFVPPPHPEVNGCLGENALRSKPAPD